MTHWKKLTGSSNTLSADDFVDENGKHRSADVTITAWEPGVFESEEEAKAGGKCVLLTLDGWSKQFASRPVNCMLIEAMLGPDVEDWVGHSIRIGWDKVESAFKGALSGKPCIRVKGSRELTETLTVSLKLPRKKQPLVRKLTPSPQAAPATQRPQNGDANAQVDGEASDQGLEQARAFFTDGAQ